MATAEDGVMQMGSVNPAVDDAFQKNISGATNGAAELPIVAPNDPELESEDPVAAVPQERVVVRKYF